MAERSSVKVILAGDGGQLPSDVLADGSQPLPKRPLGLRFASSCANEIQLRGTASRRFTTATRSHTSRSSATSTR